MLHLSQVEKDLEADGSQNMADSAPASIGIIIPPADIKSIVDRAARFVASVKPWFEKSITEDDALLRKYHFLYGEDPYHGYYRHRVSELRAQNGSTPSADGNEKTGPFTDYVRKLARSPTGMTTVSERRRKVLKWYEKGRGGREVDEAAITVVSPITGELIPVNKMIQHMRDVATDPKYKEQKEKLLAKAQGPPETKRQRLDDSLLVPEDQFLAQHPGPVCISVWVPEKGRMLEISAESSSESVSSLKEKIAGEIEVPANKQKLSGKAGFLKDNLSLAYYNVAGGEMLSLSWC